MEAALQRGDLTPLARALYMPVLAGEVNGFEKDVALYLDDTAAVGYPDILVSLDEDGRTARLLVLERKGRRLNPA